MTKYYFLLLFIFALALEAEAATYWVSPGASGQHCVNSAGDPGNGSSSQTITQGAGCLSGGDTLLIKTGTYSAQLFNIFPSGTAGAPTTIKPAPGATVTVRPTSGTEGIIAFADRSYITIGDSAATTQNFIFDASQMSFVGSIVIFCCGANQHHIILDHLEIANAAGSNGIGWQLGGGSTISVLNSKIHHNGTTTQDHGLYIHGTDWTISQNEIYSNSGYGVHVYDNTGGVTDRAIVSRNNIHDNGAAGILLSRGNDSVAVSNLVINNVRGIAAGYGGNESGNKVYGNTIVGAGTCVYIGEFGTSTNMEAKNNICHDGTIIDNGTNTVFASNLCTNAGTGCALTETAATTFVNPAIDWHLKGGSAAINAGATLGSPYNVDYAGNSRIVPYDIGAYKFFGATLTITAPTSSPTYTTSTATINLGGTLQ